VGICNSNSEKTCYFYIINKNSRFFRRPNSISRAVQMLKFGHLPMTDAGGQKTGIRGLLPSHPGASAVTSGCQCRHIRVPVPSHPGASAVIPGCQCRHTRVRRCWHAGAAVLARGCGCTDTRARTIFSHSLSPMSPQVLFLPAKVCKFHEKSVNLPPQSVLKRKLPFINLRKLLFLNLTDANENFF